jgi:hypothetical protein
LHDREPELGQLVAVLAGQLADCTGETFWPAAGFPLRPGMKPLP